MFVHRLGADMKVHRACQMVSELADLQDQHLATAIRIEAEPTPESPDQWCVRIQHALPPRFASLVDQAIRTTRSALDDLAVSLVVAAGRTPRDTRFPIALNAQRFAEEQRVCLRRATPAARDAVRSVSPWRGGNDMLWELQLLDTEGRRLPTLHLGQSVPREPVRVPAALRVLQKTTRNHDVSYPLGDHSVLRLQSTPGGSTDPATLLRSTIRIVLGEGELLRGEPVVDGLDMLISHVAGVIEQVVAAAEGS